MEIKSLLNNTDNSSLDTLVSPQELYFCIKCNKKFDAESYKSHRHAKFMCKECDRGFDTNELLCNHKAFCHDDGPFKCLDCGKAFVYESKFKEHKHGRNNSRFTKCSECPKWLPQRGLRHHLVQVHNIGSFGCKVCNVAFSYKWLLERHKNSKRCKLNKKN